MAVLCCKYLLHQDSNTFFPAYFNVMEHITHNHAGTLEIEEYKYPGN